MSQRCDKHEACDGDNFCDIWSAYVCRPCSICSSQQFLVCKERCAGFATTKGTNVITPPGVPVVPTDPVVRPPDNNSDLPNTHVLFILLTVLAVLVVLVVHLFLLKMKILPKTLYNGQTHSQTSKWCPPCKMCYGTLCYSGRYDIVSTAQRSSENSNTDKHLEAGTKLHNRPVSLVSRDSAYETGSLKREENRQSLTNVTFRNQGLSGDDACCLHDFDRNTAESAGPTDKRDTTLYYVNETNNQGDITNQDVETDVDVGRRSESCRQSESKENKLKVDGNEPTVGVHKGPTNTAAKNEDVNKKAGNQSSGKSIDGNQSSAAASGKGRDSVRKKDSDRRQAEVKTSQPQGNTNTNRKATKKNGKASVGSRESGTKSSNKIPQDGKNSHTDDRKPLDDHSKQDAKASGNKTEGGRKPSNNSIAKIGGKGDATSDRNRKHSGKNATDTKKNEKSSQQNPQNHRAQPANSVDKPVGKTENKKKEMVVMQPTPDAVNPNNDPNRLELDMFSNVFIPKEEPRTAMGDTNKDGLVGAAQLEPPLLGNEENNALLSIQCTDHRESQKSLSVYEPLLAHPPSVQIIDGGESHVNSPALPSHLNDSGCGSVVGGAAAGEESLTASQEFQRITEQHMAERGIGRRSNDQLAFPQQVSEREPQELPSGEAEVKKFEELFPGFIHPSKQRNRWIYDQLKKIDWVMGYYSAGDSIEVYVNLGSLDPHVVEQQLADITGADIAKFHVKQNEEPEFDYKL